MNRWGRGGEGENPTTCCPPLSPLSLTTLRLTSLSASPSLTHSCTRSFHLSPLSSRRHTLPPPLLPPLLLPFLLLITQHPPDDKISKNLKRCNYCWWTCDWSVSPFIHLPVNQKPFYQQVLAKAMSSVYGLIQVRGGWKQATVTLMACTATLTVMNVWQEAYMVKIQTTEFHWNKR